MLSTEELIDLVEDLRSAGFKTAAHQYFSAQQVLLHTAAVGITDRARLETLLGPIFCTNVVEQRRFGELFNAWLTRRFPGEHSADVSQVTAPSAPRLGRSHLHGKTVIAVIALALAAVAGRAYWQMQLPREVHGVVVSETTSLPIEGAAIELGDHRVLTEEDGVFRIPTTVRDLPATLKVSSKGLDAMTVTVGADYTQLRQHLYLWPQMPELPSVRVALSETPIATTSISIEMPPAVGSDPARIGPPAVIDLNGALPRVHWWQRLIWSDVAWVSLPVVLFLLWQLWSWMRRPTLQRLSDRTPRSVKEVHLPGGTSPPTAALPLRRLAQELRRRRIVNSNELQVQATIDASLRNNGMFTPVRGSRAEPDYIALVDVASQADHRARLEDEMLGHLLRSDVLIERYVFHGDPMLCTLVASDSLATRTAGKSTVRIMSKAQVVQLEDLQLRSPEHRVLIFSDGTQFFDEFTGALTSAAEILLRWSSPTILTSKPLEQWGEIEWALDRRGFTVLPISRAGLTTLMSTASGAPADSFLSNPVRPRLSRFERNPERLLERDAPSESDIELLCSDLLRDFGERGFSWIAACAAYPEVHWGITLRLGIVLVPNESEQEKILPRMARLAWFRDGYMPNWARRALLERMPPDDEARARALLHQILASLSGDPNQEVPLRIALEAPRANTFVRRLAGSVRNYFARRRIWRKSERVIQSAPPTSPLRDQVFLRFISGASLGKLSLSAPGTLLKLLFRGGSPLLGFQPAFALLVVLIASTVIGVVVEPTHNGKVNQQVVWTTAAAERSFISVYGTILEESSGDPDKIVNAGFLRSWTDGRKSRLANVDVQDGDEGGMSPSGRYLVLIQGERFRVIESSTARTILEMDTICERFTGCFAFSADEKVLAWIINKQTPTVSIQNFESGPGGFSLVPGRLPGDLQTIALNKDGTRLAASTSKGVYELNVETQNVTLVRSDVSMGQLMYGGSGQLLGIYFGNPTEVRDVVANRKLADIPGRLEAAEYAVNDNKPLFAMVSGIGEDGTIKLIDTSNGTSLDKLFAAPPDEYVSVSFAPDGRELVAGTMSSKLNVWEIPQGFPEPPRPGRSFAVVITSLTASSAPSEFWLNDSRAISQVLRSRFGFGVTELENEGATKANVLEVLRQLGSILEPQDRLFVYVSAPRLVAEPDFREGFSVELRGNGLAPELLSGFELHSELSTLPISSVLMVVNGPTLTSSGPTSAQAVAVIGPVQEIIAPEVERGFTTVMTSGNTPFASALVGVLRSTESPLSARTLSEQMTVRMRPIDNGQHRTSYARSNDGGADDTRTFEFPAPLTPASAPPTSRNVDNQTPPVRTPPPTNPPTTNPPPESPPRTLESDINMQVRERQVSFKWQRLGDLGAEAPFTVINNGPYRWNVTSRFEGSRPTVFTSKGCEVIEPKSECTGTIVFEPNAEGEHESLLILSGTVERPQGTLSAKIPPIEVRGRVVGPPWRLELRGSGQVTQDQNSSSWTVPEILFRAAPGQRAFGEVEIRNPLDRPIRLVRPTPRETYVSATLNVEKDSCTETLPPYGTCYFTFNYVFAARNANTEAPIVRPNAPTVTIDGASPTQAAPTQVQQASPTQASPTTLPGTGTSRNQTVVVRFYEEGDTETDEALRDRARIILTTGSDAGAKTN